MRVGLLCPYDLRKPGGVQEHVRGLQAALLELGDEAVLIAPGAHGAGSVDLGSSLSIAGNRSQVPLSVDPAVGRRIRRAVAGLDLVHVHEPLMPLASLFALRCGRPVVATFHAAPGPIGSALYKLVGPKLDRILGPRVRALTAVSRIAARALPERLPVSIIPNGLDVAAFERNVEPARNQVCFLGRDEKRKGLDVLLAAWETVRREVPDAGLKVMGADRHLVGIEWMGTVSEETKIDVLAASAVFVAPHLGSESFGIVLVEAMAAGAAVLASDLDAFHEVAGSAALYFETGSSRDLADQLVRLLKDEETRLNLRAAGRVRSRRYDWEGVAAAYRDVYRQALS